MKINYKIPITLISVFGVIYIGRKIFKMSTNDINNAFDLRTEKNINTLHPKIRGLARQFIAKAKSQGIDLVITDAFRTYAQQNAIYAQGRTKPGPIVTNAPGGFSNHNFGLAFDVYPIENGKINFNSKNYDNIAKIGKSLGFKWGGDWKGTKFKDLPHFEMMFGNSLAQLRTKIKAGNTIPGGYANV